MCCYVGGFEIPLSEVSEQRVVMLGVENHPLSNIIVGRYDQLLPYIGAATRRCREMVLWCRVLGVARKP